MKLSRNKTTQQEWRLIFTQPQPPPDFRLLLTADEFVGTALSTFSFAVHTMGLFTPHYAGHVTNYHGGHVTTRDSHQWGDGGVEDGEKKGEKGGRGGGEGEGQQGYCERQGCGEGPAQ